MASVDNLIQQLASTTVDEEKKDREVSFVGKSLQLNTEADAGPIVQAIDDCPGMTTLRLEGNTVGIPAAKVIAKALEKQPNFKKALWKDMFTGRDKTEIPEALNYLSQGIMISKATLTILDLSDNAFGPRGLVGLQKLLESPACYMLQELHLNNNGLGVSGANLLSQSMCKCIENSKIHGTPLQLKIFVCGRNRLENPGATAVSKFLKQIGTLESVAMPQNGIYPPGIQALSDAFMSNPLLKVVNLEDNSLTEEGAEHIAKCLPSLPQLQMLNLGDCLVRTSGALAIGAALEDCCPDIREINLGFNEIDYAGGQAIVNAMEMKENLQSLNLNGNSFGEEGCQCLIEKMSEMKKIDVFGSLSDDEGDNDDEDDDYPYDDDEEDEDDSQGQFNTSATEKKALDKPLHQSPMLKSSPTDFTSSPTAATLLDLLKSNADFTSALPAVPTIKDYTDLFFKICSVVSFEDAKAKEAAIKFADDLLPKAYDLCSERDSEFNNEFLVSIGLIKGEDKSTKCGDVTGVFMVLAHSAKQSYFRASTRDLLQFFLSQPLQYVTANVKAKHLLMQTLYQM